MIPIITANSDKSKRRKNLTNEEKIAIFLATIIPSIFLFLLFFIFIPNRNLDFNFLTIIPIIFIVVSVVIGLIVGLGSEFRRQSATTREQRIDLNDSYRVKSPNRQKGFEFDDQLNIEPVNSISWDSNSSNPFFCVNCGSELKNQDNYCATCGQLIE